MRLNCIGHYPKRKELKKPLGRHYQNCVKRTRYICEKCEESVCPKCMKLFHCINNIDIRNNQPQTIKLRNHLSTHFQKLLEWNFCRDEESGASDAQILL